MFYLINLIDFCKYALVLHSMAATHFKRVGKGATKVWGGCRNWGRPRQALSFKSKGRGEARHLVKHVKDVTGALRKTRFCLQTIAFCCCLILHSVAFFLGVKFVLDLSQNVQFSPKGRTHVLTRESNIPTFFSSFCVFVRWFSVCIFLSVI